MTTPALCQPKNSNGLWLNHDWHWRKMVCKRCGAAMPKKVVDDKPEKSKDADAE